MTHQLFQKAVMTKLSLSEYEMVRRKVLQRDRWRCQSCGSLKNLEVHHQQFRSQSGEDRADNLITLCTPCHASVHHQRLFAEQ